MLFTWNLFFFFHCRHYNAINCCLTAVFILLHRFEYIVFPFLFKIYIFFISLWIFCLTHWFLRSVLFNVYKFVKFPAFLQLLTSKLYTIVVRKYNSCNFNLKNFNAYFEAYLILKSILENVLCMLERNAYSIVLRWSILYMSVIYICIKYDSSSMFLFSV